jgi:hypothetical protein
MKSLILKIYRRERMRKFLILFFVLFLAGGVFLQAATRTLTVRKADASMGTGSLLFKIRELEDCVSDCKDDLSKLTEKGYKCSAKIQIIDGSSSRIVVDLGKIDDISSPSRISWSHRKVSGNSLLVRINDSGFLSAAQKSFEEDRSGAKISGNYSVKLVLGGIDGESDDAIVISPEVEVDFQVLK